MDRIKIGVFEVGMMPTNCYYVFREDSDTPTSENPKDCIVFDPGDSGGKIYDALIRKGLTVRAVFLTHAHFDHILGVPELIGKTGAPLYAYEGEKRLCADARLNLSADYDLFCTVNPDVFLKDEESIEIAGIRVRVLATPGHTEGSCCYVIDPGEGNKGCESGTNAKTPGEQEQYHLIAGDTVFAGSVGRTDFPTGSMSRLLRSIREKILPLPENMLIYPGHGGITDLRTEKETNPYFD